MKPYFQDEAVKIYHGDCLDVMSSLPQVDLIATDPPYGFQFVSNRRVASTTAAWVGKQIKGDEDLVLRDHVLAAYGEWVCFGSLKTPPPHGTRATAVWDKGPASGMGDLTFPFKPSWELIFFRGDCWQGHRDEGVIKGHYVTSRASMGRVHPNEKPVSLLRYLLSKHVSQLVLDPFMGSGSTLRAAKDLGRKAIGIEIEEKYCEIAAERMAQGVLEFACA